MSNRIPRGPLGMVRLGALTKDCRDRLYGGPGAPCGKHISHWKKVLDDAIRISKFRYEECKALADEFVEIHGVAPHPPTTNHPADYALMLAFQRFIHEKTTPERRASFTKLPGYIKPGVGVKTMVRALEGYEYARELLERARERAAGSDR